VTKGRKILMKGNEAVVEGAIAGGCEAFFGYPITPQNEVPEYMSKRMIETGRIFLQAESEIASINMLYGAASAGARVMSSSSSPGISLMMEGLSYCAGAELPVVVMNCVRGGPGLGNIAPAQGDYNQATKGGGHGDYHLLVFTPWNVQEMYDLTKMAFDVADKYRNPTMILSDAVMGAMIEPIVLAEGEPPKPPPKPWATDGMQGKREHNIINSLDLTAEGLEQMCLRLQRKYEKARKEEVRFDDYMLDDADVALIAFGACARVGRTAVQRLRADGIKAGLFRPISVYPFPESQIQDLSKRVKGLLVVEMNEGQMLLDVRLAVNGAMPVHFHGRLGGVIPSPEEVVDAAREALKAS
jgi:2-oxoglutarate ferredoxin oxidoreductase subunit alpha